MQKSLSGLLCLSPEDLIYIFYIHIWKTGLGFSFPSRPRLLSSAVFGKGWGYPCLCLLHWQAGSLSLAPAGMQYRGTTPQKGCLIWLLIECFMNTTKFLALFSKLRFPPFLFQRLFLWQAWKCRYCSDPSSRKDSLLLWGVWLAVTSWELTPSKRGLSQWLDRAVVQGPCHFCA